MVKIPERSELDHLAPLEVLDQIKNWTKRYWHTKKVVQLKPLIYCILLQ